jgi:acetolactate synthase-1/2/3 large subunit
VSIVEIDRPQALGHGERKYNSDVIAEVIRSLGFRYIALTPGSSFRGLHDSIVNYLGNTNPQMIMCLHEEVAISLAHGYSKAVAGPCPVLIHDLVGLMNGSMAVYNAFCDRAPVLVIGGGGPADRGRARRPIDNIHSAESQGELVREYTKWVDEPITPYGTAVGLCRALQYATSAPTGPTYVTVDVEMAEEPIPADYHAPDLAEFEPLPPLAADPELVDRAIQLLSRAKLPVIVADGWTTLRPESTPLLVELAETLGAGYREGTGVAFPTSHPLNVTTDRAIIGDADVVLMIDPHDATALLGNGVGAMGGQTGDRTLIELGPGNLHHKSWSNAFSNNYRRDLLLLSDPIVGLRALVAAAKRLVSSDQAAALAESIATRAAASRAAVRAQIEAHWTDRTISAGRFTSELWEAVRDHDWLLVGRSDRYWSEGVFEFKGAGQFLGGSGGGGVGYGTGAAVGGALAARDRGQLPVAVVGDGDFMMANSALWTAVHYHLPLLLIVNDNHSFGNDEEHQRRVARQRERPEANAWIGVHIDDPAIDYAAMARAMGCHGEGPITVPGDLKAALTAAVKAVLAGAVAVVHVVSAHPEV